MAILSCTVVQKNGEVCDYSVMDNMPYSLIDLTRHIMGHISNLVSTARTRYQCAEHPEASYTVHNYGTTYNKETGEAKPWQKTECVICHQELKEVPY